MKKLTLISLLCIASCMYNKLPAQVSPVWQKNIYPTQTSTQAWDVNHDNAGNIYMISTSSGGPGGRIDVQKYSAAGELLWMNRLNGYFILNYHQSAIDAVGNVYVTYYNNAYDLLVTKINSNNAIVWTYTYIDAGQGAYPENISIGADGNIYVCGYTYNSTGTNQRSLIVKLDVNGNQFWDAQFDLNGSNADELHWVTADINGDVWATGLGYRNAIQGSNMVTLKYNSTGTLQWSKEINGTGNSTDQGWFILPDNSGNAYIAGDLYTSGQATNVYTIKYDASGNTLWSNEYNGTGNGSDYIRNATVDNSGNFITASTGYSSTTANNIETRKFAPDGTISWTAEYNTTESGYNYEYASAVVCDASGNIFVSGLDQTHDGGTGYNATVLIKYNSAGTQLFATIMSEPDISAQVSQSMTINTDGNILITDTENEAILKANIRAYTSSGSLVFDKPYQANAYATEIFLAMQGDNDGNTYAAVYDYTGLPYFVKYDNSGNELWRTHYSGNTFNLENLMQLNNNSFLDAAGNFYVVGDKVQASGYYAMAVSKISTTGTILWTSSYNAPGTGHDYCYAVTVDNSGNVYITGKGYKGAAKGNDIYTVKFNSSGVQQWSAELEGYSNLEETGTDLKVDNSGNVYVTGYIATSTGGNSDVFVVKYNSSGVQQWLKTYDGSYTTQGSVIESGRKIRLDNAGNIYVAADLDNGQYDAIVIYKFDPSGNLLWSFNREGTGSSSDFINDMIAKNNLLYVCGSVYQTFPGENDAYLAVLHDDGTIALDTTYSSETAVYTLDNYKEISVDEYGNIICAGESVYDTLFTIINKYTLSGNLLMAISMDDFIDYSGYQYLNVTDNGGMFLGVTSYDIYTAYDPTIVKFCAPAQPTITPDNSTTFCAGNSVNLAASSATTWLWNTGATTSTINVNASGNYSVINTFQNGCSATSEPTTVIVNPNPVNTISLSGPATFCDGASVTLTADETGATYLWSNGATTQSNNVTATGNYSVEITNAYGCSLTSASIPVTVNPNPVNTVSASGPTTFCGGGSVILTADENGASYLWNTGATTQSIAATITGNYYVTVTNGSGCSLMSSPVTVTVNSNPVATITPSGPTTFCTGGSVTLDAGAGFSSYLWSNGATTQFIVVSTGGNYSVTVTNASGCSATSTPTTVTVNPSPTISITAGGATTFCQGGSVVLTATFTGGTSLQWKKNGANIAGATSASYTVNQGANYSCTVTGTCGSATSNLITVTVNKNPKASITAGGPTTFCAGGSVVLTELAGAGQTYQWYKGNAIIAGATTTTYTATTAGNYKCKVTKTATGCMKTSNTITVTVPCKESELTEGSLHIYPNPTSGVLTVDLSDIKLVDATIRVLDLTGRELLIYNVTNSDPSVMIDLTGYASGIYLISIANDSAILTERIVKQ